MKWGGVGVFTAALLVCACGGARVSPRDPVSAGEWCGSLGDAYCEASANVYEEEARDVSSACPAQFREVCESLHRDEGSPPGNRAELADCTDRMHRAHDVATLEAVREHCQ